MHRSLKPHAQTVQAKKVQPPTIPGDPTPLNAIGTITTTAHHLQHQQQIPLYRLGVSGSGSISSSNSSSSTHSRQLADDGISMSSSIVSSPSLEEGGFNLPRETSVALRMKDETTAGAVVGGNGGGGIGSGGGSLATTTPAVVVGGGVGIAKTPAGLQNNPLLTAPPPSIVPCPPAVFLREPLTHKAAVYYHQQLALQEDQGIDLTQSPGRDSPGSSSGSAGSGSRHSTASLDSGRASSYLTGVSGASLSRAPLSSPRCSSVSSCSIGSVDRQRNDELIIDWLMEMKCEEYAQLFIGAGYDLPTIARMTPEDLTAIGIKNPHHRERIKQRIDKLQVLDNLPHFVPGSIEEWLQLLRLEEYIQPLLDQNYKTVRDVTQVTWEDLEDIGIVKLGHQKKILLAIKRVKDIISGKWNPGGGNAYQQQEYRKPWQFNVPVPSTPTYVPTARVSWDDSKIYATPSDVPPMMSPLLLLNGNHQQQQHQQQHHQQLHNGSNGSNADAYYCTGSNHECCNGNDVVLIKVRQPRGKSLESLEDIHDNSTRSHLTFSHYTTTDYGHFGHTSAAAVAAMQAQQQQQAQLTTHGMIHQQQQQQQQARLLVNPSAIGWRRSYDDGDITPTNDANTARELMYEEGGGTLPRQQRGILQRAVLNTMPPLEHHYMNAAAAAEYVAHAGSGAGGMDAANAQYITGSPMASKKIAPEPPRRHCSIRNSRTLSGVEGTPQTVTQQGGAMLQQTAGGAVGWCVGANMLPANLHWQQQQQAAAQQQQQQPIYANYATIQQTTAEIHCEKYHDNKSNSSIDSIDTIPFANENTGTIKQRLLNRQDITTTGGGGGGGVQHHSQQQTTHLHSSSSSSSSSSTNTIANIAHSFHSLKSSSSLHDASLIRSDSIGSNASGGSGGGTSSMLHLRSPTLQYPPTTGAAAASAQQQQTQQATAQSQEASSSGIVGDASGGSCEPLTTSTNVGVSGSLPPKVSVNVLNDIGNMLANLTDELDAMLEEEKRVGLNIDSE